MLIDFSPTVSDVSLTDAFGFQKAAGGAAANVAVGISRLGGRSTFVGKVGDDEFGCILADILRENNVMDQGIRFDAHAKTTLAFVPLKMNGEREFMLYRNPSADMLLKESKFDAELIREASVFHYGSTSLIVEPTRSTHLVAMAKSRQGGEPDNDEVVMSLWYSKLKLLLVTDGPKGYQYYTKSQYRSPSYNRLPNSKSGRFSRTNNCSRG